MNPNAYGALTDGHDYTFLDGRLTPFGQRKTAKISKQREIRDQIINLSGEIDFAVERHKTLQANEAKRKQDLLDRKLKPKGQVLLNETRS